MGCHTAAGERVRTGFTLIELLVVMAIIATLMTIVAPRYLSSVDKAAEAVLRTNLRLTRDAIDKYRADTGHYPENLQTLVSSRYLRDLPVDPITEQNDSWLLIIPPQSDSRGVYDIRSGAKGVGKNGKPYSAW
ncbi:MAG: prepilin-type N-terminal cleavage/methylation domain-containing protein [Sphingobacteriales bacterium]|nr:MAG: prepilin-type N-terminal cleavage/methylation domain-containing protein [Sphingobacteriales bacterium]